MDEGELVEQLIANFREGAAADALLLLARQPDRADAAAAISAAINALYNAHRDVANMILAAHLGSAWCLGQASLQSDPEFASALKSRARAICFNAAANCWPGWNDEGVTINDEHIAAGLALAGLCGALVEDLGLGPKPQGKAQWLVGALELALGRLEAARAAFRAAHQTFAALGEDSPDTVMALAYDALAAKCESPDLPEAALALSASLERLRSIGSEESRFYADQVDTAARMFNAPAA